jgi:hypothetical protein
VLFGAAAAAAALVAVVVVVVVVLAGIADLQFLLTSQIELEKVAKRPVLAPITNANSAAHEEYWLTAELAI